jgi:hypothetical protein
MKMKEETKTAEKTFRRSLETNATFRNALQVKSSVFLTKRVLIMIFWVVS